MKAGDLLIDENEIGHHGAQRDTPSGAEKVFSYEVVAKFGVRN
jgi:hypothetical protein